MHFQRPPKPDLVEVMAAVRRRVFVQTGVQQYVVIVALKQCVEVQRWQGTELVDSLTVWCSAAQLGLYDGLAWNVEALATWLKRHCVVCWQPLGGKQRMYCSSRCKQKAYRSRK